MPCRIVHTPGCRDPSLELDADYWNQQVENLRLVAKNKEDITFKRSTEHLADFLSRIRAGDVLIQTPVNGIANVERTVRRFLNPFALLKEPTVALYELYCSLV